MKEKELVIEEVEQTPELVYLVDRLNNAIKNLSGYVSSSEESLNRIDPDLLGETPTNSTPKQIGVLGELRHSVYELEDAIERVGVISSALNKIV